VPSAFVKDLGFLYLSGLLAAALPVVFECKRDFVALIERAQSCHLEGRGMDKDVLGPIFGSDEAEAFSAVEKFNSARNSHNEKPFPVCVNRVDQQQVHARPMQLRFGKRHLAGCGECLTKNEGAPTMDRTSQCDMGFVAMKYKQKPLCAIRIDRMMKIIVTATFRGRRVNGAS
jgi:hypothetical protein